MTRKPLLAGNWKMNNDHLEAIASVQKLAWSLRDARFDASSADIAVIPPFTDIRSVQTLVQADKVPVAYGAQDLSAHDEGAYTGEVSGRFLSQLGCEYVVVGHSERRAHHGEDDELVGQKVRAARRHGLAPILCVGEPQEVRAEGGHVDFTLAQVRGALEGLNADDLEGLVIAYEPVWAIGTGETATAEDAGEMASAVRGLLTELFGDSFAQTVRVLYGGSVNQDNVGDIMRQADVDGALVGGASLDPAGFAALCRTAVLASAD